MTIETIQVFLSLATGFATAGAIASGYQCATAQPLSFRLFGHPERMLALAAVPMLTLAAPFIIMRNTLRARRIEPQHRTQVVAIATVVAGVWSLMSGTAVISALQVVGVLA